MKDYLETSDGKHVLADFFTSNRKVTRMILDELESNEFLSYRPISNTRYCKERSIKVSRIRMYYCHRKLDILKSGTAIIVIQLTSLIDQYKK